MNAAMSGFVRVMLAGAACLAVAVSPGMARPGSVTTASSAPARIDRFLIEKRISPALEGRTFGNGIAYELIIARAYASLDPGARANADIVGLDLAPRNAAGRVEYSTQVTILKPVDMGKSSGNLVYEVINRSVGGIDISGKSLDVQGLFPVLLARGDVIVDAAWQGELTPDRLPPNFDQFRSQLGGDPIYAQLPPALENGKPAVRHIRHEEEAFNSNTGQATTRMTLVYPAVEGTRVTAYWRRFETDEPKPVPEGAVRLADRMSLAIAPVPGAETYDIFYDATDAVVSGVGLAVPRDVVAFLRFDAGDGDKRINPLLGESGRSAITRAYAYGLSQSGRFLRAFLYHGFNADPVGRKVFDGLVPVVAGGRQGYFNEPFSNSGLSPGGLAGHRILNAFPFAYPVLHDPITGRTDGLLRRCLQTRTCPRVIQIDSEFEAGGGWGWLMTTRPDGAAIRKQPDNVRLYAITGGDHGGGRMRKPPACRSPMSAPAPVRPFVRAALVNIDLWVRHGRPAPASRYPGLADGTLTTIERARQAWPAIPGFPYATARNLPEHFVPGDPLPVSKGSYPLFVFAPDADGIALGGLKHPMIAVPTGTATGVGQRMLAFGHAQQCPWIGEFLPFARTRAERLASGDPRPSLEERYPGGTAELVARRRAVAQKLVEEGYLLSGEAEEAAGGALDGSRP